ncbi:acyltransferase family protein [Trueperella bernardiae]|uniref:acyltransferase family protein n=1 Tax=Trueperella bernardiae TaxID=59561 RepID=UPI0023F3448D|nr:acyltransferase family protein [Trueperella bernardiae]
MSDHGGYIPGLDGVRALAVTAVIAYHLFPGLVRGGFLGVDVFFVLSGFLITTLLLREDRKNNYINLKAFWQRRLRRLIPALVALILVVVPVALAINRDLLVGVRRQVLGALTFSTNWLEIAHGSSYFDQTTPNLFKNFWSLAIEEQFYLFWPLLMLVVLALLPGWRSRVALAAGLALGSAGLMMVLYNGTNATTVYYGTHTHLFGIAIGIGLAFLWADGSLLGRAHWRQFSAWYGWAALALLLVFMLILPDTGPWAYVGGMFLASLLTVVLIASMLVPGSVLAMMGEWRVPRWIGTRSYGLYLWHWPVLVMVGVAYPVAFGSVAYLLRSLVAVALTAAICEVSYRYLETPVRKRGIRASLAWAYGEVWQTVAGKVGAGVVAIALVATGVGLVVAPAKSQTQLTIEQNEDTTIGEGMTPQADVPLNPAETSLSPTLDTSMPTWPEVTAIGDSMVAASKTGLEYAMPGITFLARSNLKWSEALGVVQAGLADGSIGRVVILHYGTNAGVSDADVVRAVIQALGPDRMVLLVNLYSPSTFIDSSNEALAEVAGEYPNVMLVDWHKAASENPNLLQVDATHTSIEGANFYGNLMKESIEKFSAELTLGKGAALAELRK